jgi:hypothetical protein
VWPSTTNRSSSSSPSSPTVRAAIADPSSNSRFDGLDSARPVTAGTLQSPDARGQAPRLLPCKHNEDAHPKRTQVATENLSQDFPGIFPNKM